MRTDSHLANEYMTATLQRLVIGASLCGSLVTAFGCQDLTHVSEPDVVVAQSNNDSVGAVGRRAGAIVSFANGFGGQVVGSGLIADELGSIQGGGGDQRIVSASGGSGYPYDVLGTTRINLLRAITSLERWAPTPAWHIGELYAYLGDVEVFYAENMCSGVPLGVVVNDTPTYGATATRDSLIQLALAHFDSATAHAGGSDSVQNLAAVGRARALLDSGDFPGAASQAAGVPQSFAYTVSFAGFSATGAQSNSVWYNTAYYAYQVFVSDNEGENGLDFISANDPRVATTSINGYAAALADSSSTSPMVLASGLEAVLMQAEAALRAGNVGQWASSLNMLRTSSSLGLAPLPADSTTSAPPQLQLAVMFRERAFWLFLTGHRHGDLRRLVRQYGLPAEKVFPTGPYEQGQRVYGSAVVYVPFGETLNPNFRACFNTSA
jgi:hypothetical protein